MATRYYVNPTTKTLLVSENPEEHTAAKALGFKAFSAWYALQYASFYASDARNSYIPEGFTLEHMRDVTESVKLGYFGTYEGGLP